MDLNEIIPRLFVGSSPESVDDVDRLRDEHNVSAVLCLQTEEDFEYLELDWEPLEARYRELGMELRRVPVRDFDEDDLRKNLPACVAVLQELLDAGHTVYVHCNLGVGRSPSVAVAYLHWIQRRPLDEAAEHVYGCRNVSPNLRAIRLAGADRQKGSGAGTKES